MRGAPAIAIVAALALAVELRRRTFASASELEFFVRESLSHLRTSRPTAVNLFEAAERLEALAAQEMAAGADVAALQATLVKECEDMLAADVADNRAIGKHGATAILTSVAADAKVKVLTHCNTGALWSAGRITTDHHGSKPKKWER